MAHGPCGVEFKDAFSCFVYSKAEEKGSDCLTQFQAMQNCMEQHPDIYHEDETSENEEMSEDDELTNDTSIAPLQLTGDKDNIETSSVSK